MPRTKQVRKKSSVVNRSNTNEISSSHEYLVDPFSSKALLSREYESDDHLLRDLNTYYDHQKQKNEVAYSRVCEEVKNIFSNILAELPDSIKLTNVHKDIDQCYVGDENLDLNTTVAPTATLRISSPLKPTNTTEFKMPKEPPRANKRCSSRKLLSSVTQGQPAAEVFKTPLMNSRRLLSNATITPKIYNDNPITVMRRPLHGEVAISMDGSPLMVGPTLREDIPTVNVPLQNGKIFSIIPEAGTPPDDLPHFDEITRKYLKTLRDHLRIIAPNSPIQLGS
uniref:Borealin C-terminal domain-containing protein n=1 Tax=Graphocephala atropunctata TaxID=36148 RepID=A0A1B6M3L4_9HEMI